MTLAPLTPKQAADALLHISTVTSALQRLPYREAVEPLMAVHELQAALYATFPGGYVGECSCCDEPKGKHEVDPTCDGIVCFDCIDAGRDLPTISTPAQEPELA